MLLVRLSNAFAILLRLSDSFAIAPFTILGFFCDFYDSGEILGFFSDFYDAAS